MTGYGSKVALALAAVVMMGCAAQTRMGSLSQYDAEYQPWASAESVSSVQFQRQGSSEGNLTQCVAEVVSNQGETLTDSSGSFFGAYTGNYYNVERNTSVAGGSVIEHAVPDSSAVVASGSTRYSAGALVERSVRFKLTAKQSEAARSYRYSSIGQAQLNSGVVANTGYGPVGAFQGANPDLALQALAAVTDNIETCLAR